MTSVDDLRTLIQAGRITPQSPLDSLKFVGPYLYRRLQQNNMNTVAQLVQYAGTLTLAQLRNFLTHVTENRHANQCAPLRPQRRGVPRGRARGRDQGRIGPVSAPPAPVAAVGVQTRSMARAAAAAAARGRGGGEPARGRGADAAVPAAAHVLAPRGGERYHVRDVNRAGFNTLRNLLHAARLEWPHQYQHAARLPREHGNRDVAAALCSCKATQAACAAAPEECAWRTSGGQSLCVPMTRNAGFEGIDGFSGQRRRPHLRNDNLQFVAGWRVPDPYRG